MKPVKPWRIIPLGFVLVVLGFVLPVLMVSGIIQPTLWLSMVSHMASISGLILGLIGVATAARTRRD